MNSQLDVLELALLREVVRRGKSMDETCSSITVNISGVAFDTDKIRSGDRKMRVDCSMRCSS